MGYSAPKPGGPTCSPHHTKADWAEAEAINQCTEATALGCSQAIKQIVTVLLPLTNSIRIGSVAIYHPDYAPQLPPGPD